MPLTPAGLPASVGVGFKPCHFTAIVAASQPIGFFEIHAENFMGAGGPPHAQLARLRQDYALSIHGVGLSVGSMQPLDLDHLARVKRLCDRYEPESFSEHLAWSSHDALFLNDLLPLPYTDETLGRVADHVDQVQNVLGRQMLLENPSTYLEFEESSWPEGTFLAELARRTGCGLLLDVNNVVVASHNQGRDPRDYMADFPVEAVREIHLGGHSESLEETGALLLIDSHDRSVQDPVWALYEGLIARIGPVASLIEWDNDVPEWPALRQCAETAQRRLDRARPRPRGLRTAMSSETQSRFARALLDGTAAPQGVKAWDGSAPERRFAVHRTNVAAGWIGALASRFPVTETIVGPAFFAALARSFVERHPPRSPVLLEYGDDLPGFIEGFEPVAGLPYLADVARLEVARGRAYHAADAVPLEPAALAEVPADRLAGLTMTLHPAASILRSRHPIVTIWAMNAGEADLAPIESWAAEDALVARPQLSVTVQILQPGSAAFLSVLGAGAPLGAAIAAAEADVRDFDVAANIASLFRAGLAIALD